MATVPATHLQIFCLPSVVDTLGKAEIWQDKAERIRDIRLVRSFLQKQVSSANGQLPDDESFVLGSSIYGSFFLQQRYANLYAELQTCKRTLFQRLRNELSNTPAESRQHSNQVAIGLLEAIQRQWTIPNNDTFFPLDTFRAEQAKLKDSISALTLLLEECEGERGPALNVMYLPSTVDAMIEMGKDMKFKDNHSKNIEFILPVMEAQIHAAAITDSTGNSITLSRSVSSFVSALKQAVGDYRRDSWIWENMSISNLPCTYNFLLKESKSVKAWKAPTTTWPELDAKMIQDDQKILESKVAALKELLEFFKPEPEPEVEDGAVDTNCLSGDDNSVKDADLAHDADPEPAVPEFELDPLFLRRVCQVGIATGSSMDIDVGVSYSSDGHNIKWEALYQPDNTRVCCTRHNGAFVFYLVRVEPSSDVAESTADGDDWQVV